MVKTIFLRNIFISFVLAIFSLLFIVNSASAIATYDVQTVAQFYGQKVDDRAGRNVTSLGDIDGDGYDDMLIAAPYGDTEGNNTGSAYLFYGKSGIFSGVRALSDADAEFYGQSGLGNSISGAGDVNGDGYDDFLIAMAFFDSGETNDVGLVQLFYGKSERYSGLIDLDNSSAQFKGEGRYNRAGLDVSGAGDVNGDGYDDFLVTGNEYPFTGGYLIGKTYLIYGKSEQFSGVLNIGDEGVQFVGDVYVDEEYAVSGAGDVNGDGYDDFLIGAPHEDRAYYQVGVTYLVYGQSKKYTGTRNLTEVDATQFVGENGNDYAGAAISGAGDVNGDGYDDFLIGSSEYDGDTFYEGAVYLLYGQQDMAHGEKSLAFADAKFTGKERRNFIGNAVSGAGDVNGDGYNDFLIGASKEETDDGSYAGGAAYLLYGKSDRFEGSQVIDNSDIQFNDQTSFSFVGSSVSAGDVNGDGFSDVLIGSEGAINSDGVATGAAYLAYLYVDSDKDGVIGQSGMYTGTDCNDEDGTVYEEQTYYRDEDGDTLGNLAVTETVCSSVPSEGFVDNIDDTNDTIYNLDVEIDGDGIDNDGDGEIDERNTGSHPGYLSGDPRSIASYEDAIIAVEPQKGGVILVTFSDNSVYQYTIFNTSSKKELLALNENGYAVALHPKGKRVVLVNLFSGTIIETKVLGKKKTFSKNVLKIKAQEDGSTKLLITSIKKKSKRVAVVKVDFGNGDFGKKAVMNVKKKKVAIEKTQLKKNTIVLRNKKGKVLSRYYFTKKFQLKAVK